MELLIIGEDLYFVQKNVWKYFFTANMVPNMETFIAMGSCLNCSLVNIRDGCMFNVVPVVFTRSFDWCFIPHSKIFHLYAKEGGKLYGGWKACRDRGEPTAIRRLLRTLQCTAEEEAA